MLEAAEEQKQLRRQVETLEEKSRGLQLVEEDKAKAEAVCERLREEVEVERWRAGAAAEYSSQSVEVLERGITTVLGAMENMKQHLVLFQARNEHLQSQLTVQASSAQQTISRLEHEVEVERRRAQESTQNVEDFALLVANHGLGRQEHARMTPPLRLVFSVTDGVECCVQRHPKGVGRLQPSYLLLVSPSLGSSVCLFLTFSLCRSFCPQLTHSRFLSPEPPPILASTYAHSRARACVCVRVCVCVCVCVCLGYQVEAVHHL